MREKGYLAPCDPRPRLQTRSYTPFGFRGRGVGGVGWGKTTRQTGRTFPDKENASFHGETEKKNGPISPPQLLLMGEISSKGGRGGKASGEER